MPHHTVTKYWAAHGLFFIYVWYVDYFLAGWSSPPDTTAAAALMFQYQKEEAGQSETSTVAGNCYRAGAIAQVTGKPVAEIVNATFAQNHKDVIRSYFTDDFLTTLPGGFVAYNLPNGYISIPFGPFAL